jgi:hypothetical protein
MSRRVGMFDVGRLGGCRGRATTFWPRWLTSSCAGASSSAPSGTASPRPSPSKRIRSTGRASRTRCARPIVVLGLQDQDLEQQDVVNGDRPPLARSARGTMPTPSARPRGADPGWRDPAPVRVVRPRARTAGYLPMSWRLVDGTIVAAPNTSAEKQAINKGRVPEAWQGKEVRTNHLSLCCHRKREGGF